MSDPRITRRSFLAAAAATALAPSLPKSQENLEASVALCLLFDVSNTVSLAEYVFIRNATAEALRNIKADLIDFIGLEGPVAMSLAFFADGAQEYPWHYLRNETDIDRFISVLSNMPRPNGVGSSTNIAWGIQKAVEHTYPVNARRKVIDLASDGFQNVGYGSDNYVERMHAATQFASQHGIIVNGLSIGTDVHEITRDNVFTYLSKYGINPPCPHNYFSSFMAEAVERHADNPSEPRVFSCGDESFVVEAQDEAAVTTAMEKKLRKELFVQLEAPFTPASVLRPSHG